MRAALHHSPSTTIGGTIEARHVLLSPYMSCPALRPPVNLTRVGEAVLVSDARIRARMRGDLAAPAPPSFPIVRVALSAAER